MGKDVNFLYGRNSVFERLKNKPATIRKVFLADNFKDQRIINLIKGAHLSIELLSKKQVSWIKHAKDHQGIIAKVDAFEYKDFNKLLGDASLVKNSVLLLDRINDPQNLGVIIRLAACFGRFSIIIPTHKACPVNDTVLHVASGGENYLDIAEVNNLNSAIFGLKKCGFWIAGTVVSEKAESIFEKELPFPLALIMGSEGEGIRTGLIKELDMQLHIPMQGAKLSLNVSIATAIFCQEIARQRAKE
ncbi:MAG: 23S rRNA (guanosine(2251)-2'-O)-methyltransferase RlmB [Candidatus Kappaea frigidicola]|nr:23S rRNA (guanosine(2251)-2'-O)-methyltransferase RlmB [Candidatus Kappaea frigidicola]